MLLVALSAEFDAWGLDLGTVCDKLQDFGSLGPLRTSWLSGSKGHGRRHLGPFRALRVKNHGPATAARYFLSLTKVYAEAVHVWNE